MSLSPRDHFSSVAARYAECRPSYPPALPSYLAGLAPARRLVWDCGTGSGQAAVLLAEHFERVIATDPSEQQLRHAAHHPRVAYHSGSERASSLGEASCDLATAAQAAHWFDLPAFHAEVERVLKPGGVLAIWGYARIIVSGEIDPVVTWFEHERVGPYWPKGRELATSGYRDMAFPFPRIEAPVFVMERIWTCDQFVGYLDTWSAVDAFRRQETRDPLPEAAAALAALWGSRPRLVRWPIHMMVGRKDPSSSRRQQ
jgi:SAM-dependent methyltransferase